MAKTTHQVEAPVAPQPQVEPVIAPQPPQQQYYQPVYAAPMPSAPKQAKYPGLELALAVASTLASVWLLTEALGNSIALFANTAPTYDALTALFVSHLSGFAGIVVTAFVSVAFASLAFWLFGRLSNAVQSDDYKLTLHVGVGIAAVKTIVLAATTLAVGLTPLLTLQKGVKVGDVYLNHFLPLLIATVLFGLVAWYFLQLAAKKQVGRTLSTIVLIASSVVLLLGVVAVIVKSHSDDYRPYSSSTSQIVTPDYNSSSEKKSTSIDSDSTDVKDTTDKKNTSNSSNSSEKDSTKTASDCYDDYKLDKDSAKYSACINKVFDSYDSY